MGEPTEPQRLVAFRVLAAVAWADGELSESEEVALRRILAAGFSASANERALAESYLDGPVEFSLQGIEEMDGPTRDGLYRAAVLCVAADGVVAEAETTMLHRLRDGLGLSEAHASSIEHESIVGNRVRKKHES